MNGNGFLSALHRMMCIRVLILLSFISRFFAVCASALIFVATANAQAETRQKLDVWLPIKVAEQTQVIQELQQLVNQRDLELQIRTTDYWHPYQNGLRQGRPGIYFTAPHFASWAVHRHGFVPMLRLANRIQYVIATRRQDSTFFEISDLHQKTICTEQALNLDFLLVQNAFTNPLQSAQVKQVDEVAQQVIENNPNCHAFALPHHRFQAISEQQPNHLIRLQQSKMHAPYGWIAHPSIQADRLKLLQSLLLSDRVVDLLKPIYQRYSSSPILLKAGKNEFPKYEADVLTVYWVP